MRTIESNGIKIYELSKGSVIPEYLTSRRQQQLKQKHKLMTSQLEIIHDLTMPDLSTNISISPDEKFMFVLGAYSPRIRCYELEQLSMKFERYVDELPTKIAYIDKDYSKFVVLEGQQTLSFHGAGGIHKKVRCDNVVRDLIYSPSKQQLFLPDCKGGIALLNIETGNYSDKIFEHQNTVPITCSTYNPVSDIFLTGHTNGYIKAYDPRTAKKIGLVNVNDAPRPEYMKKSYVPEISTISFKDPLRIGLGTDKGMFHLYDIRNNKRPFSSRDLDYEFPIRNVIFHEDKVIASVKSVFKIWEPSEGDEGKIVATYDTNAVINDLFQFPGSGLFFAATNEPQVQTYFIPRIGDAPFWCHKLTNLIVDVETESSSMYDTHTFITREEVDELGLASMVGTANLRAYMHGFYISNETYKRASNALLATKAAAANMKREGRERQPEIGQEGNEQEGGQKNNEDEIPDPPMNVQLKSLVKDSRYGDLFRSEAFRINTTCRAYDQVNQDMNRLEKKKRKKMVLKQKAKKSRQIANNDEVSDDEDEPVDDESR